MNERHCELAIPADLVPRRLNSALAKNNYMNSETINIFNRLYKWCSRQDENFTTEAFIYVLLYLQQVDPEATAAFLRKLTDSRLSLDKEQIEHVQIKTVG